MIEVQGQSRKENGIDMLVYTNEDGVKQGINPFDHGSAYTDIMKTQALKQALTQIWFYSGISAVAVVMRKNPEQRKEFSLSVIQLRHGIRRTRDLKCGSYITQRSRRARACEYSLFPTGQRKDIWQYIQRENIEIVPLYFAEERPVIYRDGNIIMVDDDRLKLRPGEKIEIQKSQIPYSWMLSAYRRYRI